MKRRQHSTFITPCLQYMLACLAEPFCKTRTGTSHQRVPQFLKLVAESALGVLR